NRRVRYNRLGAHRTFLVSRTAIPSGTGYRWQYGPFGMGQLQLDSDCELATVPASFARDRLRSRRRLYLFDCGWRLKRDTSTCCSSCVTADWPGSVLLDVAGGAIYPRAASALLCELPDPLRVDLHRRRHCTERSENVGEV